MLFTLVDGLRWAAVVGGAYLLTPSVGTPMVGGALALGWGTLALLLTVLWEANAYRQMVSR